MNAQIKLFIFSTEVYIQNKTTIKEQVTDRHDKPFQKKKKKTLFRYIARETHFHFEIDNPYQNFITIMKMFYNKNAYHHYIFCIRLYNLVTF